MQTSGRRLGERRGNGSTSKRRDEVQPERLKQRKKTHTLTHTERERETARKKERKKNRKGKGRGRRGRHVRDGLFTVDEDEKELR